MQTDSITLARTAALTTQSLLPPKAIRLLPTAVASHPTDPLRAAQYLGHSVAFLFHCKVWCREGRVHFFGLSQDPTDAAQALRDLTAALLQRLLSEALDLDEPSPAAKAEALQQLAEIGQALHDAASANNRRFADLFQLKAKLVCQGFDDLQLPLAVRRADELPSPFSLHTSRFHVALEAGRRLGALYHDARIRACDFEEGLLSLGFAQPDLRDLTATFDSRRVSLAPAPKPLRAQPRPVAAPVLPQPKPIPSLRTSKSAQALGL